MSSLSFSSATGTTMIQILFMLLMLLQIVAAVTELESNASTTPLAVCVPFGECEPCPQDALHEPFCQPFGNRRLMHCSPNRTASTGEPLPSWYPYPTTAPSNSPIQGETPAWQSCGRIPAKEQADFYEFVACNIFLGTIALSVALVRSKTVEARQARRLAARIGLVRSTGMETR